MDIRSKIIEAGKEAGFDLELRENLGLEIKRFRDVDANIQDEAVQLYTLWWGGVYAEEDRMKIWLPDNAFQPDEESCESLYKEFKEFQKKLRGQYQPKVKLTYAELRSVYGRANKELKTSGERFPEGQLLLIKNIDGKWRPITLTRSDLWEIPDEESYPWNWYLVSNHGMGYEWVPKIVNENPHCSIGHEEILNRENPRWNEESPFFLINYAITVNPREGCRIKGAPQAAVTERSAFCVAKGIDKCETHSPLSGYGPRVRKYGPHTVKEYIKKNIDEPLAKGTRSEFPCAVKLHGNFNAMGPIRIFPNGREADFERTRGYTASCRYPIDDLRERLEAKGIINFSSLWSLSEVV